MKFLCNMGISPKTVAFLRSHGHDARRLLEDNLSLPVTLFLVEQFNLLLLTAR